MCLPFVVCLLLFVFFFAVFIHSAHNFSRPVM